MITKKAKYAMKALVYLSRKKKGEHALISEISEVENIPKKFLEAILLDLRKAGYLGSKKGKGGGYYLAKDAAAISMADIVRHFEGAIALLPCVSQLHYEPCEGCEDEATCGIREVFKLIWEQSVATLKENTFAEVVRKENKLRKKNPPN
ncbi:MAG TPA: Rrf2 family transcriptional regulator [Chitinophagales bacterium]|nr:Rrf2 family transcriptional regulator [Chitinophagales bacterium]